jgi:hypothetical protein
MAGNRRGIGPGDPGWLEIRALEVKVKQWLRKSPPNPTLEALAGWRLYEMRQAIDIGDWDGCENECQKLVRLIGLYRNQGR